ncbi:MAG: helix-turn-helix domain-containing protein [Lachnospiraceae bacterium]|nr:helix-turn-helix domain-containing protein [Lachnospiraceae bacterium]
MFSENLKIIRKEKGMSQEMLAQQIGVVRQTVSKWEKGLSVPDAEMLVRIADLFEVSVENLLGEKLEEKENTNEVAVQLAVLNEYLLNRSKRRRRIWKSIGIVILVLLILYICMWVMRVPISSDIETEYTTKLVCTLDGEEYQYEIVYDEQDKVWSDGGDDFITEYILKSETALNAKERISVIEDYFKEHGGTCERIEE